jgi:hypothetical protein
VRFDLREQGDQLGTVTLALKRSGPLVGPLVIPGQAEPDRLQVGPVMRCQYLPWDKRDIARHLIAPTGMDRGVDQEEARIDRVQPLLGRVAAMRRAVIHEPEQTWAGTLRCRCQHLAHQAATRLEAGRRCTAPPHVASAHVPGRQLWQRTPARIRVLPGGRAAWCRGPRWLAAAAGLETGCLIGPEESVRGATGLPWPSARLQVQKRAGLRGEMGLPGKAPVLVLPGLQGLGRPHPPPRAPPDRVPQSCLGACRHVSQRLPAQRWLRVRDPGAGSSLDQGLVQRGKQGPGGLVLSYRPRPSHPLPTAGATAGLAGSKGPPIGLPPRAPRAAPRAVIGHAGRVGPLGVRPSSAGPQGALAATRLPERPGRTSVPGQACDASSQSGQYMSVTGPQIVPHPLQPGHHF